ncbi:hypothetical protein LCGC14_3118950 [marine sediment metagenome]|uniref:Uncharacterized protein n=1 Tax=marine sediment metagenome TaxID=412755 RepID=A0A0F8WRT1_9ZZZZ
MSEIDLLTKRNTELMRLIQEFKETVITEFFSCPECQEFLGITAKTKDIRPDSIDCHCRCGHEWMVDR